MRSAPELTVADSLPAIRQVRSSSVAVGYDSTTRKLYVPTGYGPSAHRGI